MTSPPTEGGLCYVYRILSTVNGAYYVGSTINHKKRKNEHLRHLRDSRHHCPQLARCAVKYGVDTLQFKIVEVCDESMRTIREQAWIDATRRNARCLNTAVVIMPLIHSEETRKRIGAKVAAARKRHPIYGRPVSEETRRRVAASLTGRKHPDEVKAKIGAAHKGKPKSAEHRAKIGAARLGKKYPLASAARLGKKRTASQQIRGGNFNEPTY